MHKGKVVSKETREKISRARIGRKYGKQSFEHVYKRTAHRRGIKHKSLTIEQKRHLSIVLSGEKNGFFGKNHTFETKTRLSFKAKNRERKICLYCLKDSDVSNFSRWHGEQCKLANGGLRG